MGHGACQFAPCLPNPGQEKVCNMCVYTFTLTWAGTEEPNPHHKSHNEIATAITVGKVGPASPGGSIIPHVSIMFKVLIDGNFWWSSTDVLRSRSAHVTQQSPRRQITQRLLPPVSGSLPCSHAAVLATSIMALETARDLQPLVKLTLLIEGIKGQCLTFQSRRVSTGLLHCKR